MRRIGQALALAAVIVAPGNGWAQKAAHGQTADDVETRAMRDEMARTMKDLKLEGAARPYFVSYRITDTDRMEATASLGALISSAELHSRTLQVIVRVGSYEMDNTNAPIGGNGLAELFGTLSSTAITLPLDDNYDELRRRLWIATDAGYKRGVEAFSAKKAKLASTDHTQSVPDFSRAAVRHETESLPPIQASLPTLEQTVRAASAVFRTLPLVTVGSAEYEVVNSTEHYINSEGTTFTRQMPEVYVHASASVQTAAGEVLNDSYAGFGHALGDVPAQAALLAEMQTVSGRLTARRKGKVARRYNGPVLVQEQAAPSLFAAHFANLLSSHPHASGSSSALTTLLSGPTASLLSKVGTRVLPDSVSVEDNPRLGELNGQKLWGGYMFDEEGTPAQETVLIEDGLLKTLLTSRAPVRGMLVSTGNEREHGVLPGNLIVSTTRPVTRDAMKAQMMDLVKARGLEYGVIVKRLQGNAALEAVRVYPDGHEETMRDARVAEVKAESFKDVLAVSDQKNLLTERAQVGALAALAPHSVDDLVSYVVPDMLFEDMEIEHVPNESPKLPAEPSPLAAQPAP